MITRLKNNALVKNSSIIFAGTAIGSVFNYFFHLIVGRIVSPGIYGQAQSLIALLNIISIPALTLTMIAANQAAICKAKNARGASRELWAYLNKKVIFFGLPIFLVAVVATPAIGRILNIRDNFALILIWVSMFFSFLSAVNIGLLNGWQKFGKINLVGIWGAVFKLIFGVIVVSAGYALGGIIGSFFLSILVSYVITIYYLRSLHSGSDGGKTEEGRYAIDLRSVRRFIVPIFAGNLAIAILGNADMVVARRSLEDAASGQYGALTVVTKIIFFASGIVSGVLFSMSSEISHKGQSSRPVLLSSFGLVFLFSFLVTALYFLFPSEVMALMFSDKYRDAAPYLGWLAAAVTFYSLAHIIFQYLLSIGRTRISYVLLALSVAFTVSLLVFGASTRDIIMLTIIFQLLSVIAGLIILKFDD